MLWMTDSPSDTELMLYAQDKSLSLVSDFISLKQSKVTAAEPEHVCFPRPSAAFTAEDCYIFRKQKSVLTRKLGLQLRRSSV